MAYRPDRTQFTTQAFRYESFGGYTFRCEISGSLANNTLRRYQLVVDFPQSRVQARAFISRGGLRAPLTTGGVVPSYDPGYEIYQYAGGENVITDQHFENNGENYVVNLLIQNLSGSTVNLITQTIDIFIEFYEAPLDWGL